MDADVIVVGAGPVGLLLAAELRLAGAEPLVLERLAEPSPLRRSRGIGPLAAEALRRRGLGGRLQAHQPERGAQKAREHGSEKDHFAWIHKIDPLLQEEPDRRGVLIWQPDLEAVLGEHAAALGVSVRRGHTVTGLSPDEDGVTVTVATGAGERRLRAAFVVGCDGGRSTVRKLAGFAFPGTPPLMTARQAHAEPADPGALPPPGRLPGGMLLHGPGGIGTFDFADVHERHEGPVTAEELRASVRRVAGVDVTFTRMGDALRFTDQARQAATYRLGRVLLAGDAAHVHSPNGGQGLNLGLTDAVNLGWKLAAEVNGTAPEGLLDTYTAERHPVGEAVLRNTRAQSALMLPGPHTDALRDIVADLMDIPDVNRYFGRLLSGLGTRYAFPYAMPEAHPLIGTHCPDVVLSPAEEPGREVPLSRLTTGGRPVLFAPAGGRAVTAAAAWRDRVEVVEVTAVDHPALGGALIRPDGAIAWACGPDGGTALLEAALRTWFGAPPQVTAAPSRAAGASHLR
ncbi:FAD-dependent monooxygenase [Nonomuraea roseoviolacea subsp. roseoviolacea]|uniref:FAD-dependent monooxygenase n=1 Tax=Nonomuraea roseoviolacea TaxID=103837 RepID=UPI0031E1BE74